MVRVSDKLLAALLILTKIQKPSLALDTWQNLIPGSDKLSLHGML